MPGGLGPPRSGRPARRPRTPAPAPVRAFLGLGSNLGDRVQYLRARWRRCATSVSSAVSPVYETDPVGGPADQDSFLNLVVELRTDRTPHDLLGVCRRLEAAAERVRDERWGPRTLDVDVLWIEGVGRRRPRPGRPPPAPVGAPVRRRPAARPGARRGRRRRVGGAEGLVELRGRSTTCDRGPRDRPAPRPARRVRIVGPGPGRRVAGPRPHQRGLGRGAHARSPRRRVPGRRGVDLLVLATPDDEITGVARAVEPADGTVVAHLSGAAASRCWRPTPAGRRCTRWWRCPPRARGPAPGRRLVRGGGRPDRRRGRRRPGGPVVHGRRRRPGDVPRRGR